MEVVADAVAVFIVVAAPVAACPGRPAHLSKSIDAIEIAWDKPCDRGEAASGLGSDEVTPSLGFTACVSQASLVSCRFSAVDTESPDHHVRKQFWLLLQ